MTPLLPPLTPDDATLDYPRVFLDISIDDREVGRVVLALRPDAAPLAAENFRLLCTGARRADVVASGGKSAPGPAPDPLHLRGTPFHRVIRGFMAQGGDTTRGDGTGGRSVHGGLGNRDGRFPDEAGGLALSHNAPGVLSMANSGPDTNGSQFFITLGPAPHLDGRHVVFGRVEEGMGVVRAIEAEAEVGRPGATRRRVTVADCGELPSRRTLLRRKRARQEEAERVALGGEEGGEDDGARARIARLQGTLTARGGGGARPGPSSAAATAAAEVSLAPAAARGDVSGAVAAAAASTAPLRTGSASPSASPPPNDSEAPPTAGPRARRLAALRARVAGLRRANAAAVADEARRARREGERAARDAEAGSGLGNDKNFAWHKEKQKRLERELESRGLRPDQAHRLVSAASIDARDNARAAARGAHLDFAVDPHGVEEAAPPGQRMSAGRAAVRQAARVPWTVEDYRAQRDAAGQVGGAAAVAAFYGTGGAPGAGSAMAVGASLGFGARGVEAVIADVGQSAGALGTNVGKEALDRARRHLAGPRGASDVDHVNRRNATFNRRLEERFGGVTRETKAALERGTALPDGG